MGWGRDLIGLVTRYLYDEHIFHSRIRDSFLVAPVIWSGGQQSIFKAIMTDTQQFTIRKMAPHHGRKFCAAGIVVTLLKRQPPPFVVHVHVSEGRRVADKFAAHCFALMPTGTGIIQHNKESITLHNENTVKITSGYIHLTSRGTSAQILLFLGIPIDEEIRHICAIADMINIKIVYLYRDLAGDCLQDFFLDPRYSE